MTTKVRDGPKDIRDLERLLAAVRENPEAREAIIRSAEGALAAADVDDDVRSRLASLCRSARMDE